MGPFAIVAALLVLLAAGLWFMAVRMSRVKASDEYRSLALEQVATYQLRLKELAHEREYDELDEQEYNASVIELKRQLLQDLEQQNSGEKNRQFALFVPGMLFLVGFVASFYFVNGESAKLEQWQETMDKLPALSERAVEGKGEPLSAKELQQFALGLRTQLFEVGDDAVAWLLLGRVTMSLNDFDSAVMALERSYRLDPTRLNTQLSYAQALLMQGGANSMHQSARVLAQVLSTEPDNVDALFMVGYIAEQMQDLPQVKMTWDRLLAVLPEHDTRRAFVTDKLAALNMAIEQAATAEADKPGGNDDKVNSSAASAVLTVDLRLADNLKGKIPNNAVLFVYAKAAKGMPMPAAVVRLNQFDLPLTVELSDKNAMLDTYKLSNLDEVVVYGRVSKDGDIAVSQGELQGQTQAFLLKDTKQVSVLIDQLL